jgi:hypothetical protein
MEGTNHDYIVKHKEIFGLNELKQGLFESPTVEHGGDHLSPHLRPFVDHWVGTIVA